MERIRFDGRRSLVELGAGTGHDSLFFKEQGLDVVAIDISPRMVEHCRAKGLDVDFHTVPLKEDDSTFSH